jgi:hypothetical protein
LTDETTIPAQQIDDYVDEPKSCRSRKMAKASPFDFVRAILEREDDPVASGELDIADYNPYIVNRACAYRVDALPAVQLVNERPWMSKAAQYSLLRILIKRRRTNHNERWIKGAKLSEAVALAMEVYGMGRNKAEELVSLFGADEVLKELKPE